jgi:hypothetical protein
MYAAVSDGKQKTEAQAIFLNLFTVCLLCWQMFVVFLFVLWRDKQKLSAANGVNRLNGLAHLCVYEYEYVYV